MEQAAQQLQMPVSMLPQFPYKVVVSQSTEK